MPDDIQDNVAPAQTPEQTPQSETIDPFVAIAIEQGWKPKEDYEGDQTRFIDAKEWVRRGSGYKILTSKLKEQEKALRDMASHISKVQEASYKKAIADLTAQKKEAVRDADEDRVQMIDEQIDQVKQNIQPIQVASAVHPAVTEWLDKSENKWFQNDPQLRAFAITYQNQLFAQNQSLDMEESLREVSRIVKKTFPEKFTNPARTAAPTVQAPVSDSGGKKTYAYGDLNDEQRKIADRFERQGIMKKEKYVQQLVESGIIGGS